MDPIEQTRRTIIRMLRAQSSAELKALAKAHSIDLRMYSKRASDVPYILHDKLPCEALIDLLSKSDANRSRRP